VGDSLTRNQWESMVCLLLEAKKTLEKFVNNGSLNVFTAHDSFLVVFFWVSSDHVIVFASWTCKCHFAKQQRSCQEYKARVEFYWSPFLVQSPQVHSIVARHSKARTPTTGRPLTTSSSTRTSQHLPDESSVSSRSLLFNMYYTYILHAFFQRFLC
jgi:hypothetical protein